MVSGNRDRPLYLRRTAVPRRTTATTTLPRRQPRPTRPMTALIDHDMALGGRIAGCDEAGRGCLAGPIVAAAVCFDWGSMSVAEREMLAGLDDSKKLRPQRRRELADLILAMAEQVVVVAASARAIDRDGLHQTNLRLMRESLGAIAPAPDAALSDGFALGPDAPSHTRLVGGDGRSATIAAASIIAKTWRDRFMEEVAERLWPGYGFSQHMGYGTDAHQKAIRVLGISPIHRLSFNSKAYRGLLKP